MSKVEHDSEKRKFYLDLAAGQGEDELSYSIKPGGIMEIHRTYVPQSQRGKGLAAIVTKAGLEYALEQELQVLPTCPYVAAYINRHPEYKKLLTT